MHDRVGEFYFSINNDGYPILIEVGNGINSLRFTHKDIIDLERVVRRLKRDCRFVNPNDEKEIG